MFRTQSGRSPVPPASHTRLAAEQLEARDTPAVTAFAVPYAGGAFYDLHVYGDDAANSITVDTRWGTPVVRDDFGTVPVSGLTGVASPVWVWVSAADGADRVSVLGWNPAFVDAGAVNDSLYGGAGDDLLV